MPSATTTASILALWLSGAALAIGCGDINVPGSGTTDTTSDVSTSDTVVVVTPGDPVACATYCDEVTSICTGANEQYISKSVCLNYCKTWAGIPKGSDGATSGNSATCRTYHAGVAATGATATHCVHAGPTGGDTCGTWCDNYCHLALRNCTGALKLYDSDAACQAACKTMNDGDRAGAKEGDSVQCRINNLALAQAEPGFDAIYCPRGAQDGGDTCATLADCGTYCTDFLKNCTGGNNPYTNEQQCNNVCELYSKFPKGAVGTQSGNTVACRTYHAGLAGLADAGTHCRHAGPTGGNTCGTWCENYCHLAMVNCTGEFALYPDLDACMDVCKELPNDGALQSTTSDTVQCRIGFAGTAGIEGDSSAITQCPQAAEWGPSCREPLPTGCTGGKASTIDGCLECGAASANAADAVGDLAELYEACESDADCALVDPDTECAGACDVAVNGKFVKAYESQISAISDAYCKDFAAAGALCVAVDADCEDATARCVSGACKAQLGL
ncbi:MAG: hypothetical protein R3F39_03900 [Myxococcota bacterium]